MMNRYRAPASLASKPQAPCAKGLDLLEVVGSRSIELSSDALKRRNGWLYAEPVVADEIRIELPALVLQGDHSTPDLLRQ